MQKKNMLKLLAALALLISAPAVDAAPLVSEPEDIHQEPLHGGDQEPTDPWPRISDDQKMTAPDSLAELLKTGAIATYSNGRLKTAPLRALARADKTTRSPVSPDKSLTQTSNLGRKMKMHSMTKASDNLEKIVLAASRFDRHRNIEPVTDDPEIWQHATTDGGSLYRRLMLTTDSNKQGKTLLASRRVMPNLATSIPNRQEKLLKMLNILEALHRAMNSTLSSRITIIPRGNNNGRSPGKKSKMVMIEGSLKSTTVSSVVSGSMSPRTSTDQTDPKLLNGKTIKKSLPSTTKKASKRVCFWKYCSQN